MNKYLIAAGVLVLAAAMCIPVSVFSDGSDAFDIKQSEAGISWESDTLSEEQVNKLYSEAQLDDLAEQVMDVTFASTGHFLASNVKVSDLKVKEAQGFKVTDKERTVLNDGSYKCKITFRATVTGPGYNIFTNMGMFADLIKYVKFDNRSVAGMYFDFDVEFEMTESSKIVSDYTQNKDGNYVVTKEQRDTCNNYTVNGTVKCVYDDGTGTVEKEFTLDFYRELKNKGSSVEYEFAGDVADVKDGDRVLCGKQDMGDLTYKLAYTYKADGKNGGGEYDVSDIIAIEGVGAYTTATIFLADDLEPRTYEFYPTGGEAYPLFYSVNDPALASNDALKAFLDENGTIGETFGAAEDLADSEYSTAKKSKVGLYVGIGVAVVAVVAIAAFVVMRMKQ